MSDPKIVAPSLRASLDEAVRKVKPGKKGRAGATVTLQGAELDLGFVPRPGLDISGYVSKSWKKGWTAGARVGLDW